jgi:anti-sigma-K factor RskA
MTERELLAAEIALRLLEGEELDAAMATMANDAQFAELVREWELRLAPMAQGLAPLEPAKTTWPRIAASLNMAGSADNDNEADAARSEARRLRARLWLWQWGSVAAAAASLVIGVLSAPYLQPGQQASQPPGSTAETLLYASLPVGGPGGPRLALTYLPQSHDLLVLANAVPGDGVHDHELWLVVPDAKPVSMGVIVPGRQARVHVSPQIAARIGAGLGVILTREPLGGAPQGGSAGPVVAEGEFTTI